MSNELSAPSTSQSGAGSLLRLLLDGRPRTRAELARATGLARSTVTPRLDALIEAGLITSHDEAMSTGGRPASRFAFNPAARVTLAADLGATHAAVAVTDLTGAPLATRRADLDIADGPEPILDWLVETGHQLLADAGRQVSDLVGVGIGVPGPVEHSTGRLTNPPIMPGWDRYDVPAKVGAGLHAPVLVDNDVNVMALGEHATAFPDEDHLIFVKVATGIGSGIISGGRLHQGAQGSAGDLGHVLAPHGGDATCRCGNTGCLEAVASGAAVAAKLREQGLDAQSSRDVVALVRAGNMAATQAVRQAGRDIGEVLAACVSLLNPSVIVVGGSLAEAGEMLLAGVREAVYRRSLPLATQHLRIVTSQTGSEAGVVGAATMVIQNALSPTVIDAALAKAPA
ncbi:MAG: ROK family protein [Nocardioidaceae bacterium]